MSGNDHDTKPSSSAIDMDVEMNASGDSMPTTGNLRYFPLRSRIIDLLTDLNVTQDEPIRRAEFMPQTSHETLWRYAFEPSQATTTSEIFNILAQVASTPGCAYLMCRHMRPLLVDIFGRWLLTNHNDTKSQEQWERELFVMAEVAEFVPELWK
jgi:hypothetical protein